eukprot:9750706-Lingulodinium_polyedra.AAC.1
MVRIGENCALARFDPKVKPLPRTDLHDICHVCTAFVDLGSSPATTKSPKAAQARLTELSDRHRRRAQRS